MKKEQLFGLKLLLSTFILLLVFSTCKKKPKQYVMNGKVITTNGNPVDRAVVKIGSFSVTTKEDGLFATSSMDEGTKSLSITTRGYDTFSQNVNLTSAAQVSYTIQFASGAPKVTDVKIDTLKSTDKTTIQFTVTVTSTSPVYEFDYDFYGPSGIIGGGGQVMNFTSMGNNIYKHTASSDVANAAPRGKYYYKNISIQNQATVWSPAWDYDTSIVLN